MSKKNNHEGIVYKVVIYTGTCNLGQLIAVYSSNPEKTLKNYLDHCAVGVVGEPKVLEGRSADVRGIDTHIQEREDGPGYAIKSKVKTHWIDRGLVDDMGGARPPQ